MEFITCYKQRLITHSYSVSVTQVASHNQNLRLRLVLIAKPTLKEILMEGAKLFIENYFKFYTAR